MTATPDDNFLSVRWDVRVPVVGWRVVCLQLGPAMKFFESVHDDFCDSGTICIKQGTEIFFVV